MGRRSKPRDGSLQYWPRSRAKKFLPSVNWKALQENPNALLLGFIGYKVGMASVLVKDSTPNSMTKDKRIPIPASIIEAPPLKILSVRFYQGSRVIFELLNENIDKELKRKLKLPKKARKKIEEVKNYDDLRIIAYSVVKQTGIKKSPDIAEIGLAGSLEQKLNFIKEHLSKEIHVNEVLQEKQLIDVRGLTKGYGLSGPVKRFGIGLRGHKSEKGRRRPGSLGPWHPAYVTFKVAQAGQFGMFSRMNLNAKIIKIAKAIDGNINPKQGFHEYGAIKSDYLIVRGSVSGAKKRQVLLTFPLRKTKEQEKKNFEFIKIIR